MRKDAVIWSISWEYFKYVGGGLSTPQKPMAFPSSYRGDDHNRMDTLPLEVFILQRVGFLCFLQVGDDNILAPSSKMRYQLAQTSPAHFAGSPSRDGCLARTTRRCCRRSHFHFPKM